MSKAMKCTTVRSNLNLDSRTWRAASWSLLVAALCLPACVGDYDDGEEVDEVAEPTVATEAVESDGSGKNMTCAEELITCGQMCQTDCQSRGNACAGVVLAPPPGCACLSWHCYYLPKDPVDPPEKETPEG
ncbi:MAG: hypothetical protein KC731_26485 [Myxococcales bacterium]|nr:hypothetical protein [Myxococcales bacterium]